ncbi:MAG: hypothetical protein WCO33_01150 [bacterium]
MENTKNTKSLIVVVAIIMISSLLIFGVLLYVRGQNVKVANSNSGVVSNVSSSTNSSYKVPTPTGNVVVSIDKVGTNKYNLNLNTNGTKVTALDLRFAISDGSSIVIANKGVITNLNDLFLGKTENGELTVQAGNLTGFTGSGVLATLSLADTSNRASPTLSLESTSFANAGVDMSLNELSNTLVNYNFTLE